MDKLEIFKAGRQTASNGITLDFGEDQLRRTAEAYDPKLHEAPIVVGHPKDDAPAYGWIRGLNFADGTLTAETAQVDPEFAEMVKAGRFKKRSASFYRPDSPANPVPGVFYLRHVGFLGAQPPAVKGLADPEFNDSDDDYIEFADTNAVALIFRRLREFLVDKFGLETADQTVPAFLVEDLEEEARRERDARNAPSFSEDDGDHTDPTDPETEENPEMKLTPEQIKELQEKAARAEQLEQENAELKAKTQDFSEREAKLRRAEIERQVDALVAEGKVLPAHRDGLVNFMAELSDEGEALEFGEGDDAEKVSAREFMRRYLESLPKIVDFQERGAGDDADDADDKEIAQRAVEYRERMAQQGVTLTTVQAVRAVREGKDKA